MSKFADAESECQDDKDETIAGCKLVQFRFVKKMINGQTVRYLVGEGEIQANSRPPEIRGIQIERQGLSIDTRKLEQEP